MPESQEETTPVEYHFLEKVGKIPLVSSALSYAESQYNALKDSNTILSSTIVNAGSTAMYLAGTAAPVVTKTFGKQIAAADSLASKGLDLLTDAVPAINTPTEELLSVNPYENLKKYGYETVQNVKNYGYTKVNDVLSNPYAQVLSQSVNTAVDITESAIDRYLPPTEGESHNNAHSARNRNVIQRVSALSEKMRKRMFSQAVNQVQSFQRRSHEALEHMRFSVDLIQYAKLIEENGRKTLSDGVSNVREQAKWLWDELNKDESEEPQEAPKSLDQQILLIARRATRNVMKTYNVAALSTYLPDHAKQALGASVMYAADVYSQLSKAGSLTDVSEVALNQMTSGVALMHSIFTRTLSPFLANEPEPQPESSGQQKEKKGEKKRGPTKEQEQQENTD